MMFKTLFYTGMLMALASTSAYAQTVSGHGVSGGDDAVSIAVPQVRDLGLTVSRIATMRTQIIACGANGELVSDNAGNCSTAGNAIDIDFANLGSATVLYIQNQDGKYEGNSGALSATKSVYFSLDGPSGSVDVTDPAE